MRVLVFVQRARNHVLATGLAQLRDAGAKVSLVANCHPEELEVDAVLAEVHHPPMIRSEMPAHARFADESRRLWGKVRNDRWVRGRACQADVLVALDRPSIHTVWELAARHRKPVAVYGIVPALEATTGAVVFATPTAWRAAASRVGVVWRDMRASVRLVTKRLTLALVSKRAMRNPVVAAAWRLVIAMPGLPDRVRVKIAHRVQASMAGTGRKGGAPTRKIADERSAAILMVKGAMRSAAQGEAGSVADAAAAMLALADSECERGSFGTAAADLNRVTRLLFHRGLHFDSFSSPLADAPEAYLAPWRASAAVHKMSMPRSRSAAAATPPGDRPLRLLITTTANANFLHEIRRRYEDMPGVEVRFASLADDPQMSPAQNNVPGMMEHLLTGRTPYGNKVTEALGPLVEWADTVFIDWCVASAVLYTMIDPGKTRIIVRLHSFEAFSWWPHLVDFSRVDDIVFVSDHLRDLANEVLPRLAGGPRQHVIANAMDLASYPRAKDDDARFRLALIGVSSIAKDPRWAIEVLRILRRHDKRYQLVLMGDDLQTAARTAAREYQDGLEADLAELEPSGAVMRLGHVSEVAKALVDVGVILSTSARESFHCGLVEGAASGAVPVVRDWPFFADKHHGAHTLFPPEWVVDSPEAAAQRIIDVTSSVESWRAAGAAASAHVLREWDWSVIAPRFDGLLLPTAPGEGKA